jgi:hypothetical protein
MLWQEAHTCLYTWKPLRMLEVEKGLGALKIPLHPVRPETPPASQLHTWCGPRRRGGHDETMDSRGDAAPDHWHSQRNAEPPPALHPLPPARLALTASPSGRGKGQTSRTRPLPARAPLSACQDTRAPTSPTHPPSTGHRLQGARHTPCPLPTASLADADPGPRSGSEKRVRSALGS